ncbi:RNA polymerase sigma-70 factor (ECF subfamily) [Runella defluvii]|uniref:RNA polymerase sigma-70 factor (ECF subfamily) n=1 Tax=Runella defluvii TaxID=370973 RepID=A0A7W5ZRW3_9BACT|nr:RNA polymerase sigma-70 factor [Runella defluvii]MBB3841973.1 RNA polymerase sigma-70 factor (ECF subfamily) [Runella defluvii]
MTQPFTPNPKETVPEIRLLPDEDTTVMNQEEFLRKLFEQDPQKGCEHLFRRYYANLCNHAIRFVYAKDIAEEIVAEVFANFWQNRIFERITVSYQAYLYKAVRYRAYNYLKYELNRSADLESVIQLSEPSMPPDAQLHYNELAHKVENLIQGLPPQSRKAFQLNRIEGKKYAEIAEELDISVSAVERLISRALAKLRQGLKGEWLIVFFINLLF